MSGSFIFVALIVAVLLVFWRLTLVVAAALLIAMLVTGVSAVTDGLTSAGRAATSINLDPSPVPPVQATPPH